MSVDTGFLSKMCGREKVGAQRALASDRSRERPRCLALPEPKLSFFKQTHDCACSQYDNIKPRPLGGWSNKVKSTQAKVDKFLHKLEASSQGDGKLETFVEHIQDNENWALSRQSQHLFQAFLRGVVTRLSCDFVMCLVNTVENTTARTRASRKLGYK
jgi:hypothetical protein